MDHVNEAIFGGSDTQYYAFLKYALNNNRVLQLNFTEKGLSLVKREDNGFSNVWEGLTNLNAPSIYTVCISPKTTYHFRVRHGGYILSTYGQANTQYCIWIINHQMVFTIEGYSTGFSFTKVEDNHHTLITDHNYDVYLTVLGMIDVSKS